MKTVWEIGANVLENDFSQNNDCFILSKVPLTSDIGIVKHFPKENVCYDI